MAKAGDVKETTPEGTAPKGMVELKDGGNKIKGDRPGSSIANTDYTFEELGDLMTFVPKTAEQQEEGSGEWMTVLADYVSGAGGQPLFKGQVKRLSQFVTNYGPDDTTRAAVLRLLQMEAIRKSTREEAGAGIANITMESESPEVKAERAKRMIAEDRLAALEKQIAEGQVSVAIPSIAPPTDPNKAGKDVGTGTGEKTGDDEDEWGEDEKGSKEGTAK